MTWDGDTYTLGDRWFKVAPVDVRGERTHFVMVWDDSMGGNYGGHYRRVTEFAGSPSKRTAKQWVERYANPQPPDPNEITTCRGVGRPVAIESWRTYYECTVCRKRLRADAEGTTLAPGPTPRHQHVIVPPHKPKTAKR